MHPERCFSSQDAARPAVCRLPLADGRRGGDEGIAGEGETGS
jgi:hypothetical protein